MQRTLSVVIPAYNEEGTIGAVLAGVRGVDLGALGLRKEIIVVDDGSVDGTARVVAEHSDVRLLRRARNGGKGRAIRTGLAHTGGDLVLIQDADLEYDPADYPTLLAPLVGGRARVVFGSRFLSGAYPRAMHPANYLANRALTFLTNVLYGMRITDEATGFKVFEGDLIRRLPLRCRRFEFCPEVVSLLGRERIDVLEVPIRYHARSAREGKKITWRDGLEAVKTLVSYRLAG